MSSPEVTNPSEKASPESTSLNEKAAPPRTYPPPAYGKEDFLQPDFDPAAMQRVVREGILLGGGAAAILLQVASPGVAAGVNEHSNFAYRVQDRLRTTLTFVYCMSFGTPAEKQAVVDMINRAHAPVHSTLTQGPDAGKPYSAMDPELQLWVAATLYATGTDVYQRLFGRLDDALHDQMYREYSVVASSLQVPPDMWPPTRADFWRYWNHMCDTLVVTDNAREVCRDLLALKHAPLYFRVLLPYVRLATAELLPEKIRAQYGMKIGRAKHAWFLLNQRLLKAVYPALPLKLRSFPVAFYLKDMRKRLRKEGLVDKNAKIVAAK